MGGDGGSIPGRADLVRTKKKGEKLNPRDERRARWMACAISQELLRKPVVACELGHLYNKETILQFLLDRKKYACAESFDHIRSLKDVHELHLTENKDFNEMHDDVDSEGAAQFVCPVSGLEMNGLYRFCFVIRCCCVFSERALKAVQSDACRQCGEPFKNEEVILLNSSVPSEVDTYRERMLARKAAAKKAKKEKKEAKLKRTAGNDPDAAPSHKKAPTEDDEASSTARRPNSTVNISLGVKINNKSIQQTSGVSQVYKNLFTTSAEGKKVADAQAKARNWVTYNPQYFG